MTSKKILWSNIHRTRYFLIPDSEELSPGNFVLRTPIGHQIEVDPHALKPFEVTREQAKEWLEDQFGQVLQRAKGNLIDALSRSLTSASDSKPRPGDQQASGEDETRQSPKHPGLSLLAALSGESEENLRTDTHSIGRGMKKVLQELGSVFEDSIATNDHRLDAARRRVARMRRTFNAHGIAVSDKADELPGKIRKLARSAQNRRDIENAAAGLEKLAREVKPAAEAAADQLRKFAQRLKEGKTESTRTADKKDGA